MTYDPEAVAALRELAERDRRSNLDTEAYCHCVDASTGKLNLEWYSQWLETKGSLDAEETWFRQHREQEPPV